ncbi:glucosamine-6-phosphate deaminase [Alkalibacterium sp. m-11]
MDKVFVENYDQMSEEGFEQIKEVIETVDNPVLSINTGGTPRGLYKKLVEAVNNGLDISETTFFVFDEYVGPKDAIYTVRTYLKENFLNLIDTQPKAIYFMDGSADDLEEEIARYKELIAEYAIDLQLLGLGTNGHIGANEPGTAFDADMLLADHTDSTIESTMKEYGITDRAEAPDQMITLGFSEILEAEKVLLLISGKHKADATKELLEGEVTEDNPASILKEHKNFTVIIDEDAASLVEK